jgi:hypothetical protein
MGRVSDDPSHRPAAGGFRQAPGLALPGPTLDEAHSQRMPIPKSLVLQNRPPAGLDVMIRPVRME